jgi:hypothetical protein
MAFSNFQYPDVVSELGLTRTSVRDLFANVPPLAPTAELRGMLATTTRLANMNNNEKARSEWLIALLLADVWGRHDGGVALYSGIDFQADPDAGLSGFLDFAFCRGPQDITFSPPALLVVESKRDDLHEGLGQCVAGLVGAQRYNRRHGIEEPHLYGCVTTGSLWRFLRLSGTVLTLDQVEYNLGQIDRILGAINSIIAPPAVDAA